MSEDDPYWAAYQQVRSAENILTEVGYSDPLAVMLREVRAELMARSCGLHSRMMLAYASARRAA